MPAEKRKRATQDRSIATRDRLLEATLTVIQKLGWAKTSTPKICEEANVSNGAQTHHFPKKNELLIAALKRNRDARSTRAENHIKKSAKSFSAHLDMFRIHTRNLGYEYATLESLIAARTDASLREDIQIIDREWISAVRKKASELEIPEECAFSAEDLIELTLHFTRSLVVHRGTHGSAEETERLRNLWRDVIMQVVEAKPKD